jgi:hypothetical protein
VYTSNAVQTALAIYFDVTQFAPSKASWVTFMVITRLLSKLSHGWEVITSLLLTSS